MPPSPAEPEPAEDVTPAQRHYLDHASTSPLRDSARSAMHSWLEWGQSGVLGVLGDPGRLHEEGRRSRVFVEEARDRVAGLFNCSPSRVVFTASATESVNTAVAAAVAHRPDGIILAAGVEHSSVLSSSRRAGSVRDVLVDVHVDKEGMIDLDHLRHLLDDRGGPPPALVHCQAGNHEIGTIQPVGDVVAMCRERGVPVHIDAAAAAGHMELNLEAEALGADYVSVSSHKLGGPPGVGALVLGRSVRLSPLLVGGAEERGRRAGAENVVGLVGLGAVALELQAGSRLSEEIESQRSLSARLVGAALAVDGVSLLGPSDSRGRLPHITCLLIEGALGEAVLIGLDRHGIAVHSGSACSSEQFEPSPVLAAIGADGDRSLRLSVGWSTTPEDIDAFAEAFPVVVSGLRELAGPS